jgi:hypothetical protein
MQVILQATTKNKNLPRLESLLSRRRQATPSPSPISYIVIVKTRDTVNHTTYLDIQMAKETISCSGSAQEANQHDDQLCDISRRSHDDAVPPVIVVCYNACP